MATILFLVNVCASLRPRVVNVSDTKLSACEYWCIAKPGVVIVHDEINVCQSIKWIHRHVTVEPNNQISV